MAYTGQVPDTTTRTTDADWWTRAACKGESLAVFFPEGTKGHPEGTKGHLGGGGMQIAAAQQICRSCPVQLDCLEDALSRRDQHGMWGGKTEQQRKLILAHRRGREAS